MNEEQLRTKINELIKTQPLQEYLLNCLKSECELNNFLNHNSSLVYNAWQRLEKKIENCQQIETDLPNELILPGNYRLLSKRLDELRLQLAILYAGDKADKIIKENFSYIEIKNFILKILKLKIGLTLNYFDLTIKLLKKNIEDQQFNKEYIGALDLLQKFVTEKEYISNEADLKYISGLDHGNNKSDIRKNFYGIIHELDNKLLFQDLLKQLLEIIKNKNDSPLIPFCSIFIEMCLADAQMGAEDLHQALHIMHSAFKDYNKQVKSNTFSLNRLIRKDIIDLKQFEKDKQEKISHSITDNLANKSSQKQESVQVAHILKEFYFRTFFTTDVYNEKIKLKLYEARAVYNQLFKKKITTDNFSSKFFKERWEKISSTVNQIIEKGKAMADTVEKVEFAENLVTTLIKKISVPSFSKKHEDTDQIDLNNLLAQDKEKLSSIEKKLNDWNLILNYIEPFCNQHNQNGTGQIKITKNIADFEESINEKYTSLKLQISKIIDEFERINNEIEKKDYWLVTSEINKISLSYKIFHRGYFNIDFSIKKLKAELGDTPSFDNINNFISKQSFWSLLFTYGIVRWPWLNKTTFAHTWAEQLCLPGVINQTEELKTNLSNNSNEDLVRKIIVLLNAFPSYQKNKTVDKILNEFKKYVVAQLNQLENFKLDNSNCLKVKITSFYKVPASTSSATDSFPHISRSI
jgi:hypothetical protein